MILTRNHRINKEDLFVDEAILTTQNGYIGIRGCFEEGIPYKETHRGSYINGIYDTHVIPYGERAYGFPELGESMVNLPDAQIIQLFIEGEEVNLKTSKILTLKRSMDLAHGMALRSVLYETPKGYQIWIHTKRLAHLKYHPLFLIDMTIESVNYEGSIDIRSNCDANVANFKDPKDIRMNHEDRAPIQLKSMTYEDSISVMSVTTQHSNIDVVMLMAHSDSFEFRTYEKKMMMENSIHIDPNHPYTFQKKVIYLNSKDHKDLSKAIKEWKTFLKEKSLNHLYETHQQTLSKIHPFIALEIESEDLSMNESIQYALYQLYTSGAYNETVNIPAKGLTGEGYEGHTFWDTEIYMFPFFLQVDLEKAKSLLIHRHHQLDAARKEARLLGVEEGVKFAWRTITGKENSSYYAASTAQYHINSDIAYAVIQYYRLTRDESFMKDYGFELLLETARFFKTVVHDYDGHYHLHHVTGPDEYNAVIDDNYYTNALLKYHLTFLIEYIQTHQVTLSLEEISLFNSIKDRIYLGFDKKLGIDIQDASFLSKKPWDLNHLKSDQRPLLNHFHPLTIYRHQVLKQADTVLSHLLLSNRPNKVMETSMHYYEPKTTHDSSLSYCVHAAQYARLSQLEKAHEYFLKTLRLDLDNTHKNTAHGLHVANLGGIYFSLLYGFIGYEIKDEIAIYPRLPHAWTSLKMMIRIRPTTLIELRLTHQELWLTANEDTDLNVHGKKEYLKKNETKILANEWF
jgi:alpha,alpha-trehalose phosphorylase